MKNVKTGGSVTKKIAVQFEYNPAIRVCVPITGDEDIFDVDRNRKRRCCIYVTDRL